MAIARVAPSIRYANKKKHTIHNDSMKMSIKSIEIKLTKRKYQPKIKKIELTYCRHSKLKSFFGIPE